MSDLTLRFENLKRKREELSKKKIQCEVRRDSLQSELQSDLKELQDKYGVSTLQDAKRLLTEKELDLESRAKALEDELSKYEKAIDIEI